MRVLRSRSFRHIIFAVSIVAAAFVISKYFYQLILIQGRSMEPAYHNMQLAVIDKFNKSYDHGDVIVFHSEDLEEVLVKRVAAVPGDVVLIEEGTLLVNGEISSVYAQEGIFEYAGIAEREIHLSEGQFFVIGDNIAESKDSRYETVGIVREGSVIGKLVDRCDK